MRKFIGALLALALILASSGCGLLDWIFPDKAPEPPGDDGYVEPPGQQGESTGRVRESTLFVADGQAVYVLPISYPVPWEEGIAKAVVSHLVEGGPAHQFLATRGLRGVLPAGTRVLGMAINEGVAIADFSEELLNTADSTHERLLLDSLTYTLTEFDSIDKVTLWVNGQPISEMTHGTLVAPTLSRARGINTQASAKGTGLTATIYLTMANPASGQMLVPITRAVPSAAELCLAALEQLIGGPGLNETQLASVLPGTARIQNLTRAGNTVAVDFSADLNQAESLDFAVAAIVLTLTEIADISEVQLTIDGQPVTLANGKRLVDPVMRPLTINPLAF